MARRGGGRQCFDTTAKRLCPPYPLSCKPSNPHSYGAELRRYYTVHAHVMRSFSRGTMKKQLSSNENFKKVCHARNRMDGAYETALAFVPASGQPPPPPFPPSPPDLCEI